MNTSKKYTSTKTHGFTLVELIVVITILAILGTIGFVQLWGFAGSARDSVRISNLTNLKKGLDLSQIQTGVYPLPESSVNITASGTIIGYQWFAKEQVEWVAKLSPWATKDPSDTTMYTTYSTNANQTKMQAMVFLEDSSTLISITPPNLPLSREKYVYLTLTRGMQGVIRIDTANASSTSDYSKRFPSTTGDSLGILLSNSGTDIGKPAQEIQNIVSSGALDIQRTSDAFKVYFSASDTLEWTGTALQSLQISYLHGAGFNSPSKCPTGFIPVPGNKEFNQPGFCVAKYEMSYDETTLSDVTGATNWNTRKYNTSKTPVSMSGRLPITELTQQEAIDSCKKLGAGYHLITNNEWMTIARNIEANSGNWSSGITGSGYISNGVSHDANAGCGGASTKALYPNAFAGLAGTYSWGTTTGEGWGNAICDGKRQHKLSNNQIIWDLSGNVWEHVNKANTMDGTNYGTGWTNLDPASTTWHATGWNASVFDPSRKLYGPSSNNYTHTVNGVGNIHGISSTTLATGNIFLRGSRAAGTGHSGIFTLNLGLSFSYSNPELGFRCAR